MRLKDISCTAQQISFMLLALFPILKFSLSTFLIILFCLSGMVNFWFSRKFKLNKKDSVELFFLSAFLIVLVFSLFYSEDLHQGIKRLLGFLPLLLAPFISLFSDFKIKPKMLKAFEVLFIGANVLYCFALLKLVGDNVGLFLGGMDSFYFKLKDFATVDLSQVFFEANTADVSWFFFHKAYFSLNFLFCIFILISYLVKPNIQYLSAGICMLLILFFLAVVYWASSIPNLIALIASSFVALIFVKKKRLRIALFLSAGLFCIVSVTFFIVRSQDNEDLNRGFNFFRSIYEGDQTGHNDPRMEIYRSALPIVMSNPIFGVGIGDVQNNLMASHAARLDKMTHKNLIPYSESLEESLWIKSNLKLNVNKVKAPDGMVSADMIVDDSTYGPHHIFQKSKIHKGKLYTLSVFAKNLDGGYLILRLGDITKNRASFDLSNAKLGYKGENVEKTTIEAIDGGWYRYAITVRASRDSSLSLIGLAERPNGYNYKGAHHSAYIWGLQLAQGQFGPYVKNRQGLLKYAIEKDLNTHNNYLFLLLAGGLPCLIFFLIAVFRLSKIALVSNNFYLMAGLTAFMINLLSENMLSRQFGIVFLSLLMILCISEKNKIKT